jgi:hypothetical protein
MWFGSISAVYLILALVVDPSHSQRRKPEQNLFTACPFDHLKPGLSESTIEDWLYQGNLQDAFECGQQLASAPRTQGELGISLVCDSKYICLILSKLFQTAKGLTIMGKTCMLGGDLRCCAGIEISPFRAETSKSPANCSCSRASSPCCCPSFAPLRLQT